VTWYRHILCLRIYVSLCVQYYMLPVFILTKTITFLQPSSWVRTVPVPVFPKYHLCAQSSVFLLYSERSFLRDSASPGGGMRAGGPPPGFAGVTVAGGTGTTPPPTNLTQHQLFESLQVGKRYSYLLPQWCLLWLTCLLVAPVYFKVKEFIEVFLKEIV
jgi:hypothetical protein